MMESCLGKPERVGPVVVDDIKRDLLGEFTALPAQDNVQAENLQVFLRVRPFTAAESDSGEPQDCVTIEGPDTVVLKAPRSCQSNRQSDKSLPQTAQRFTFTQVFEPEASQRKVFDGSVRDLVRDVLKGGNCLVFTYGVTNAGKTFTFLGPDHDSGLLPRSLAVIFNSVEGRLYGRGDLKPQRCRDFSRLTPDQLAAEASSKRTLLRLLKESDKSQTSGRSTFLDGSSLSSDSSLNSVSEADSFCLDVSTSVRFSVWVSFCEIYNDNIHDLLEQVPAGHLKRTVLRLSQDVKGNSFIKDLRWVQVNSSDEAYKVMKIGKKNQSFSSTRLNQLSSRSHSIFSIRILRVDDVGVPRVLGISELCLCDLAGSERCSRTQNTGERLKEAGNINSSLLTLGKCISAMRQNQHAKFQHHVPFRESKLTHFLQFFFCGAGRVSMVVNINQSSACFDETLNVLKFSALAQKVVVLNVRPAVPDGAPLRSALELSMIIDEADQRRNRTGGGRSSLVAWETSLEDVQEDGDGEDWGEGEEEESVMEGTVLQAGGEEDEEEDRTMEEEESDREAALRLVLEAQIREEVSSEFMELFNKMEKDYSERLQKERDILEERAEKRVEILKNLVSKTAHSHSSKEDLEEIICSMTQDLEKIREDAQTVHRCLEDHTHTAASPVLEEEIWRLQEENERKEETIRELREREEKRRGREEELREREEKTREEERKQEEEIWRLQEENERKEEYIRELRRREEELRKREEKTRGREEELREREEKTREELRKREEEVKDLKKELQRLTDLDGCPNCDSVFSSLESEQRESKRLMKENKALVNGIFQLQTEVTGLQTKVREQTDRSDSLSEQLSTAETRLQALGSQSEEKDDSINSLTQEVVRLRQEVKEESCSSSVFHTAVEDLKKESQAALQRSAQKSQQIQDLQTEKTQLQTEKTHLQDALTHLETEKTQLQTEKTQLQDALTHLETEKTQLQDAMTHLETEKTQLQTEKTQLQTEKTQLQTEKTQLQTEKTQLQTEKTHLQTEKTHLQDTLTHLQDTLTHLETEKTQLQDTLTQLQTEKTQLQDTLTHLQTEKTQLQDTLMQLQTEKTQLQTEKTQLQDTLMQLQDTLMQLQTEKTQLQTEKMQLQDTLTQSENRCVELSEELANQNAEFIRRLESEGGALPGRLEEVEKEELLRDVLEKEKLLEECQRETEALRKELERLKENLQSRGEEEKENLQSRGEEEKENLQSRGEEKKEEGKVTVVEELKEEMQRLQERKRRQEEEKKSREFEAVKKEVERLKQRDTQMCGLPDVLVSPLRSNMADRKKTPKTTGRKRKSCEVQDLVFSENKRNRLRGNTQKNNKPEKPDVSLQKKIGELLHSSPSILGSRAKTIISLVSGHSVEKETVTTTTKPKRGRKKLFKMGASSPLLDSPNMTSVGATEDKESDHLIIRRQLRSKTCRK